VQMIGSDRAWKPPRLQAIVPRILKSVFEGFIHLEVQRAHALLQRRQQGAHQELLQSCLDAIHVSVIER
jgi:hypothetical protein